MSFPYLVGAGALGVAGVGCVRRLVLPRPGTARERRRQRGESTGRRSITKRIRLKKKGKR